MLKIGMYVRCSIDVENPNEPRDFISGRIVEINDFSEVAKVEFFDRTRPIIPHSLKPKIPESETRGYISR